MTEDFDRARHRLRQELAARDDSARDQVIDELIRIVKDENGEASRDGAADRVANARALVFPKWTHDTRPEQADRDMMARYNRAVIAEAAHTTRPIDWFTVAAWAVAALFSLAAWALVGRWLR